MLTLTIRTLFARSVFYSVFFGIKIWASPIEVGFSLLCFALLSSQAASGSSAASVDFATVTLTVTPQGHTRSAGKLKKIIFFLL